MLAIDDGYVARSWEGRQMAPIGTDFLLALAGLPAIGFCVAVWRWQVVRATLALSVRRQNAAQVFEQSALRHVRMTSHQLREIALTLHGIAEWGADGVPVDASAAAGLSRAVLDIADYMHEFTMRRGREFTVEHERIDLNFMLDQVISSLKASSAMGRRSVTMSSDVAGAWLLGDARALRHVLNRVLIVMLFSTTSDDVIEIRLEHKGRTVLLVIEGLAGVQPAGDAAPHAACGTGPDLRLTLASSLMATHGGQLEIVERAGLRPQVNLTFPADRLSLEGGRTPEHRMRDLARTVGERSFAG